MAKFMGATDLNYLWTKIKAYITGLGYTTNTGTVTSTGGTVAVNNIQVVSELPVSPDNNTLYLIPET